MSDGSSSPPLGVMLYGYSEEEALLLRDRISHSAGAPVELLSASGREEEIVTDILDANGSGSFSDGDAKILMFLGFDDGTLGKAMDDLKGISGIRRPIFCCLTQENVNWKLSDLIRDLLEEDRYWKGKRDPPPPGSA